MEDFTLYTVGCVKEDDYEGLCWEYIIKEDKIVPDCIVITEPTDVIFSENY